MIGKPSARRPEVGVVIVLVVEAVVQTFDAKADVLSELALEAATDPVLDRKSVV